MESQQRSTQKVGTSFPKFTDLPQELQCHIWEIALQDSNCLWAEWSGPNLAILAPIVSIPKLGKNDPPGLIPWTLPSGMPSTLESHPLPGGLPAGLGDVDYGTYLRVMGIGRRSAWSRIADSWTHTLRSMMLQPDEKFKNEVGYNASLALLEVCRLSRQTVLVHTAIVKTTKMIPREVSSNSGNPLFYPSFGNGTISGHIFKDQQTGRHSFMVVLGSNPSETLDSPPLKKPNQYTHVAARLSDIERCIFGDRLSFTSVPDSLTKTRFKELEWAVWWSPEQGVRARRPEAGHPFFCTPETILSIYSVVLHRLRTSEPGSCPGEYSRRGYSVYDAGHWYFNMVEQGRCSHCWKDLLVPLRDNYPELIDDKGHIDVVVVLERSKFEKPEPTVGNRSHEVSE